MRYYTDGSSTIGKSSAHVVTNEKGEVLVLEQTLPNDDGTPNWNTNNIEEYLGVIAALNICKDGDEVLTDSQLVVNQINGLYRVKKQHLLTLRDEAIKLSTEKNVAVKWISREENKAGKYFE